MSREASAQSDQSQPYPNADLGLPKMLPGRFLPGAVGFADEPSGEVWGTRGTRRVQHPLWGLKRKEGW